MKNFLTNVLSIIFLIIVVGLALGFFFLPVILGLVTGQWWYLLLFTISWIPTYGVIAFTSIIISIIDAL